MDRPPQLDIYVHNERDDVIPFVPHDVRCVLDVGCSVGGFGASLRTLLGPEARIEGIEAVPQQAEIARTKGLNDVHTGYFPNDLPPGRRYDLITFNDVLEHLVDPWAAMRACHEHLNPGGRVLAAIPSIQHIDTVLKLLKGRWDYSDGGGTLDRTHVRFFTRATMIELFEESGFTVETCEGINGHEPRWRTDPVAVRRMAKLGLAKGLRDFNFLHFLLVGRSREA